MNKQHPDDHRLQRYLNSACSEIEHRAVQHHLRRCPACKSRLAGFAELESILDQLPVLKAPAGLEENVMQSIYNLQRPPFSSQERTSGDARFRSELVHCFIATAATFLFISTGLWTKLMSINPVQWSQDVQSQISVLELVVQRLSAQLLS